MFAENLDIGYWDLGITEIFKANNFLRKNTVFILMTDMEGTHTKIRTFLLKKNNIHIGKYEHLADKLIPRMRIDLEISKDFLVNAAAEVSSQVRKVEW